MRKANVKQLHLEGENTTALLCMLADDKIVPFQFVFKSKFIMKNWMNQQDPTQTAVIGK